MARIIDSAKPLLALHELQMGYSLKQARRRAGYRTWRRYCTYKQFFSSAAVRASARYPLDYHRLCDAARKALDSYPT
jgi:hypothetical protein